MSDSAREAAGFLQIAVRRMARAHPFHAHLLSLGRFVHDESIETMGVTVRRGELLFLYCPQFVLSCSLDELVGVLHHEVLHVLFGHLTADPARYPDCAARTIAEEVTVNEWVNEPLPGSPVLLEDYPALPAEEDTETRYRRLTRRRPRAVVATVDDHGIWSEVRAAGALGEAAVLGAIERAARALTPEEIGRLPERMRDSIDNAGCGMAAGWAEEKLAADRAATIPWQAVLRKFVSTATTRQPSYLRPSRRFPELVGVVPGSTRRFGKPRVMVVIDTSGSMTSELLAQVAGELKTMATSHDVVVVECDAEIQRTYPFAGELREVRGGGGTDLRPPFEPAVLATIRPDVVVYFTDGEGPAHGNAPHVPVLWCLTPDGEAPATWGRTVWME